MGWKGTIRSVNSAIRAAERDAKRRQRELERQETQFEKMQELEQAAYEVDVYENDIEIIQSLHKECNTPVNWNEIANIPSPKEPKLLQEKEIKAKSKAENYKPSFFDKLLKQEGKKQEKLSYAIAKAQDDDVKEHREKFKKWESNVVDWDERTKLSRLLLRGDSESKIDVIRELNPFSEISSLGLNLSFSISENSIVSAEVHIHAKDIVPSEIKSLLKTGRLSVKQIPKGKFNEIFQDYVCSCVLRIGNELFSILPEKLVIVTAVDELLNSSTGHLEKMPILSVAISRETLQSLNMNNIDPSDSMCNFVHNMIFRKTKGFESINRLDSTEFSNK